MGSFGEKRSSNGVATMGKGMNWDLEGGSRWVVVGIFASVVNIRAMSSSKSGQWITKQIPTWDSESALCRGRTASGLVGLVAEWRELLKLPLGVGVWEFIPSPLTPFAIGDPADGAPSEVWTFLVAGGSAADC
jgi:hypothetical protein